MSDPITDRLAIQDLMARYAQGVDTRDLDLYATCFAQDVKVSGFGGAGEIQSRNDWLAFASRALERFGRT